MCLYAHDPASLSGIFELPECQDSGERVWRAAVTSPSPVHAISQCCPAWEQHQRSPFRHVLGNCHVVKCLLPVPCRIQCCFHSSSPTAWSESTGLSMFRLYCGSHSQCSICLHSTVIYSCELFHSLFHWVRVGPKDVKNNNKRRQKQGVGMSEGQVGRNMLIKTSRNNVWYSMNHLDWMSFEMTLKTVCLFLSN